MNKETSALEKTIIILILIAVSAFSIYIGRYLLTFINEPEAFRNWIASFGVYSPLAYITVTILQIMIPLIPGEPMEMIAGYAFGSFIGTMLCILAESLGSFIVLFLVRRYGKRIVEIFFEKEKIDSLSFLRSSDKRILLFAVIFIMPGTPKDLLCYFAGLTDIETAVLIPLISLGRFPSIITSTLAGDHLGDQRYILAMFYIFAAGLLSMIGILIYHHIQKKRDL